MAIGLGAASIISTGMNLLGGLMQKEKKPVYDDKFYQRSVKDAKAAGLHPLFALGGSSGGGSGFIAGQSETGSKLGDALKTAGRGVQDYAQATQKNPLAAKLAELQIRNAEINVRKNLIDEQLMASELARVNQAAGATGRDLDFTLPPATGTPKQLEESAGLVEVVPSKTITTSKTDKSRTPATKPGFDRVMIHRLLPPMLVPQTEEGWAEDMTIAKLGIIVAANSIEGWELLAKLGVKTYQQAVDKINKFTKTAPIGGGRIRR